MRGDYDVYAVERAWLLSCSARTCAPCASVGTSRRKDCAEVADLHRNEIGVLERGQGEPGLLTLLILDTLEIPLEGLTDGVPAPRERRPARVVMPGGGHAPPTVLRERLATARSGGVDFEEAWPLALAAAVNAAQWEREEWRDTLTGMVETWRAAWERRTPQARERAVLALVMPGGTPLPERACENCGEQMPPIATARAVLLGPLPPPRSYLRERSAA